MKLLLSVAVALATPAAAQSLQQKVETVLAEAGPGVRFGLMVTDADGREIVAVAPDNRFIPASNTKLFSTAAAFALLEVDKPDAAGGAAVRIDEQGNVILTGHGDARLSSAAECVSDCLAALANAVAAKTRRVRDVIGDDGLFPDQRWSPGMSWDDIPTEYGTGISALTLDDNVVAVTVTPGAAGLAPRIDGLGYFDIANRVVTVAGGKTALRLDRLPNERAARLTGTIAADAKPVVLRLGVDDPALYAAWRLKALLGERGVRVTGQVAARHRPFGPGDDPTLRGNAPPALPPQPEPLARLVPPPLVEDLTLTNKTSQNLHADLLLRRAGLVGGTGSIEDGLAAVRAMLVRAGVPRTGFDLSDGSGMSVYNRVSPRAVVRLLNWAAKEPWGPAWRATFPVAGVDGTLKARFRDTPLQGRLFAKTGTLTGTNALAGYMTARSGRTLTVAVYANDVPPGVRATKTVENALNLIAEEN